MSITLRIEEIANGWLIHSDDANDYLGSPSPTGPTFHPDIESVKSNLTKAFDEALAYATRVNDDRRRYMEDGLVKTVERGLLYDTAETSQGGPYNPRATWATEVSRPIHAYGNPGFTIGGLRFEDTMEPHTSGALPHDFRGEGDDEC